VILGEAEYRSVPLFVRMGNLPHDMVFSVFFYNSLSLVRDASRTDKLQCKWRVTSPDSGPISCFTVIDDGEILAFHCVTCNGLLI